MKENDVYEIVDRPKNREVIGSRWVLNVKRGADGEMEKFKARVVRKGYSQREGIDYNETFSPTVRFESLQALLAPVTPRAWKCSRWTSPQLSYTRK